MRLSDLSLEEKVGQMFAVNHLGTGMTAISRTLIEDRCVGGIFLGTDCLEEPQQVHRLTTELQRAALGTRLGIPLFISADFIAGAGCKLRRGAVHFPKNRALAVSEDEALAYESGRITAAESLAMGVNFNYSPVVDINNNPDNPVIGTHSFGEDKEMVSRLGSAVIRGYQEHGLIATAKHFPGHGDTHVDSHEDLPVLPFGRQRLESFEFVPFRRAVETGVEAVMVGHIAAPALDPSGLPASLSHAITTGILRETLGFNGLVVTDGLSMRGVTKRFSMEEACIRAVAAGADILLATVPSGELALSLIDAVLNAVRDGRLEERRIDESVERILAVKRKYGLLPEAFELRPFDPAATDRESDRAVSLAAARKAVTPIHGMRPLAKDGRLPEAVTLIRDAQAARFADLLRSAGALADEIVVDDESRLPGAIAGTNGSGTVLVAAGYPKPMRKEVLEACRESLMRRPKSVWIHFGSPYDADFLRGVPMLLLYDSTADLQQAAAEYVLGRRRTE
ncbi:glycoside hydrolase family 3 protein [Cohnella thermotolerans]|uniref:glycoside hydrolase family 3 protein n=1 Tax=Cohnella thermotolerans TaxID=329858 RepID=UPI0003F8AADC|nr:glycoside hydrolase family 3 N-terminal domain-containing protein [Cohnella thermotolerans]